MRLALIGIAYLAFLIAVCQSAWAQNAPARAVAERSCPCLDNGDGVLMGAVERLLNRR